ncbi:DUF6476 family protein [Neptunicoccus cionae]|uniref:DUF6476 family protein n=1 Tax=Neptunicoccus cionae TaxID=2035344 RepID=UPI000C788E76|nr:DUF6476 family protein [Amylibacter cionae]PLS22275.1 hypothetical protein C0U40_07570 [Amylibacter cionae]
MDQNDFQIEEPANLRFLRRLVTILTATMILGLLAIFAVLVMRFSTNSGPALPDSITLPDGSEATAFTQGGDWYAIVTAEDTILIYDRTTGELRQTVQIDSRP